ALPPAQLTFPCISARPAPISGFHCAQQVTCRALVCACLHGAVRAPREACRLWITPPGCAQPPPSVRYTGVQGTSRRSAASGRCPAPDAYIQRRGDVPSERSMPLSNLLTASPVDKQQPLWTTPAPPDTAPRRDPT